MCVCLILLGITYKMWCEMAFMMETWDIIREAVVVNDQNGGGGTKKKKLSNIRERQKQTHKTDFKIVLSEEYQQLWKLNKVEKLSQYSEETSI